MAESALARALAHPNGSINIGFVWVGDNVQGFSRPPAFVRMTKQKRAAALGIIIAPCSKQQVRDEKVHTVQPSNGMVHVPVSQT